MAKLKSQAQLEQERLESVRYLLGNFLLPTDRPLLIYARQSTVKQVLTNVYSALQQTEDLLERGLQLGWKRELATLFVENRLAQDGKIKSVSGRISIEQRPGLKTIMEYIKAGKVGALMCVDVSRLTRDADLVDAIMLAKACKDNHVVILTNDAMFDFNNPTRNDLDAFIEEAKAAAAFIEKHVKGKMLKNRTKKASMGLLANGSAPIGLTRDQTGDNLLPSPHADRVNWLFKRYHALEANLTVLYHEIAGRVIFPDVPGIDPKSVHLKRLDGGWTVNSRRGLAHILANPAYIGHLVFNGRIVKRNAHPAIVDLEDFQYAYDRLADVDLDGQPIERPERTVRYNQTGNTNTALLSGCRHDGTPVMQGVGNMHAYYYQATSVFTNGAYVLKEIAKLEMDNYGASVDAVYLDALFTERLLVRLRLLKHAEEQTRRVFPDVKLPSTMVSTMEALDQEGQVQSTLQSDIDDLVTEIARLERALRVASKSMDDETLDSTYATLASMRQRKVRLERVQEQETRLRAELEQARRDIPNAANKWEGWPLERRRRFVHLVTQSITLEMLAPGWLRLTIEWCPLVDVSSVDTCYLRRPSGEHWTEQGLQTIRELYPTASRMALLRMFPHRSWDAIRQAAKRLHVRRSDIPNDTGLPVSVSLVDMRIAQEFGLSLDEPDKRVWWQSGTASNGGIRSESMEVKRTTPG